MSRRALLIAVGVVAALGGCGPAATPGPASPAVSLAPGAASASPFIGPLGCTLPEQPAAAQPAESSGARARICLTAPQVEALDAVVECSRSIDGLTVSEVAATVEGEGADLFVSVRLGGSDRGLVLVSQGELAGTADPDDVTLETDQSGAAGSARFDDVALGRDSPDPDVSPPTLTRTSGVLVWSCDQPTIDDAGFAVVSIGPPVDRRWRVPIACSWVGDAGERYVQDAGNVGYSMAIDDQWMVLRIKPMVEIVVGRIGAGPGVAYRPTSSPRIVEAPDGARGTIEAVGLQLNRQYDANDRLGGPDGPEEINARIEWSCPPDSG